MTRSWQFTEAEFYVLWLDRAGEEPPEPFMFTSPTRTAEDFDTELREARESLVRRLNGDFHIVFDAMANPDLYLTAYAWNKQDQWATESQIRVRATRKGPKGYVIKQLPGATYWRRGGYTVVECDPLQLSDAIVGAMPPGERGGRGDIRLASDDQDMDHDYGHSAVAATTDTARSQTAEFLRAPSTTVGDIHIVQGSSAFGPRGITSHQVRFRDLLADGRYALTNNPEQALAVDEARFIAVLNNYVAAVIRTIKEERS